MHFRPIPRTSIRVSEISFGCWTMGGPNWSTSNGQPIGWANINDDDVLAGIKAGLDAGVNHWDNADVYGNGRAERTLASAFKKLGVARDSQVIATKVGHFRGTGVNAYEPANIRHQCEQSLRNLRTDHIDIYYFHHGTFVGPDADGAPRDYLHEAAGVMHELVMQGRVRAVGQSAYTNEDFERAVPIVRPHVLQNKANLRYDDFIRPGCPLQSLMQEHDCAFVAFGPLDQGILLDKFDHANPPKFGEGDYRNNRKDFNPQTLRRVREKLSRVKERFGGRASASGPRASDPTLLLASVVQRWVLAHERVCCVIPGFRDERQARCNVAAAMDPPMNAEDVSWLRTLFHEA